MGPDQGRLPDDENSKRRTPFASTSDVDTTVQDTEPQRIDSAHQGVVPLERAETETLGANSPQANPKEMARLSVGSSASTVVQSSRLNSSPTTKPTTAGSSQALQAELISTRSPEFRKRSAGSNESNPAKACTYGSIVGLNLQVGPHITKATLSELDVERIWRNLPLRHDINFDPNLHFRPNILEDKVKKRREHSQTFWKTLIEQLCMCVDENGRSEFMECYARGDRWCLPMVLRTIKDIVEMLVPVQDRGFVEEALNVDLLMQQFYKGMLNLERTAEWLAGVLKTHCAPMRDEEVDNMLARFRIGSLEGNVEQLVAGLRELLSVLEHMKLDTANHQLRLMRPALIAETVHYEQSMFRMDIATGPSKSGKLSIAERIL